MRERYQRPKVEIVLILESPITESLGKEEMDNTINDVWD